MLYCDGDTSAHKSTENSYLPCSSPKRKQNKVTLSVFNLHFLASSFQTICKCAEIDNRFIDLIYRLIHAERPASVEFGMQRASPANTVFTVLKHKSRRLPIKSTELIYDF